jgi:hypothetical protein
VKVILEMVGGAIRFENNEDEYTWRYATSKEILAYNKFKKPCHIDKANKVTIPRTYENYKYLIALIKNINKICLKKEVVTILQKK